MNIRGLKMRCEVQQDLIEVQQDLIEVQQGLINKWRNLAYLQEKLLRRALLVIKCDEDPKLMHDIMKAIVPDIVD